MRRNSHLLIAMMAMSCLSTKERYILYPRWAGIDDGATFSDDFRIMWEADILNSNEKVLVHRCYVDSNLNKDHGCSHRTFMYADGAIDFIEKCSNDSVSTSEEEFLETLGLYLGIICHHIGDLCTPLHVIKNVSTKEMKFKSRKSLHDRMERDFDKCSLEALVKLEKAEKVELSQEYFWEIAKYTHENYSTKLPEIYQSKDSIHQMVSDLLSKAIKHTRDVWHTVLHESKMTDRNWSFQTLV